MVFHFNNFILATHWLQYPILWFTFSTRQYDTIHFFARLYPCLVKCSLPISTMKIWWQNIYTAVNSRQYHVYKRQLHLHQIQWPILAAGSCRINADYFPLGTVLSHSQSLALLASTTHLDFYFWCSISPVLLHLSHDHIPTCFFLLLYLLRLFQLWIWSFCIFMTVIYCLKCSSGPILWLGYCMATS